MSWRDRPYAADEPESRVQFTLPPFTPVVKWLIAANVAVALLTMWFNYRPIIVPSGLNVGSANALYALGGLDLNLTIFHGQLWRLITTQYLHGSPMHLLFNMLGLYFFGPQLERQFGSRTFLLFYTFCGIVAGLLFVVGVVIGQSMQPGFSTYLIGASGSVLGLLAGCAILFPRMTIILLFFPVPIRTAAVLFVVVYSLSIFWNFNLSDAAHLGGMIGAAGWIAFGRRMESGAGRRSANRWQQRQREIAREQEDVDRILAKVHEHGIHSLSWSERRALRRATERQRQRDREVERQFKQR